MWISTNRYDYSKTVKNNVILFFFPTSVSIWCISRIARRNTDSSGVVGRLNGERLAPRQPVLASWRRPATGARPVVDTGTAHRNAVTPRAPVAGRPPVPTVWRADDGVSSIRRSVIITYSGARVCTQGITIVLCCRTTAAAAAAALSHALHW